MTEPAADPSDRTLLHASAVALGDQGVLILGPSGSGKSGLALALMALGAELIADDKTWLSRGAGGDLMLSAPDEIAGKIEARGIGLLAAPVRREAALAVAIDMGRIEEDRLPPERRTTLLGREVPLLHKVETPHYPAAILQYLKGGRIA